MSVCEPCLEVNNIPECVTNLTIGTIADFNEPVYVYFNNISMDKIVRFESTSSGAGLVTVSTIDNDWLMPEQSYEVYIVKQSETNISNRETITIGASSDTCLNFRVDDVFDDANDNQTYTNITMAV